MNDFLYGILNSICGVVQNYGVAVIVFTILLRLVCMPFDYKSRKGMRKMALIQPKLNELQKKYGNDKQKFQQKQAELMRKEHYNPLSSCLPMLLTWPLMIAMFGAMRAVANEQLAMQAFRFLLGDENPIQPAETFLWVKNLWMTDSLFAASAPDLNSLSMIGAGEWMKVFNNLDADQMRAVIESIGPSLNAEWLSMDLPTLAQTIFSDANYKNTVTAIHNVLTTMPNYTAAVTTVPGWTNVNFMLFSITVFQQYNGFLILPALAGITQVLQTKFNPQMKEQANQTNANGQPNGTGKFMKYFFPILSVFFCLTSNAAFALYWVTSNIVMWVQSVVITKILEKKDQKNETAEKSVIREGSIK